MATPEENVPQETQETPAEPVEETPTRTVEDAPAEPVEQPASAEDYQAKAQKAKEQAEYWETERKKKRDQYFREQQRPEPKQPEKFTFSEAEPKEEQFDNYSDWVRARQDWTVKRHDAERNYTFQQTTVRQQQQMFERNVKEKIDELLIKDPDIAQKGLIPQALVPLLIDSDHLAQFAYHFGEHRQDAAKLINMLESENFSPFAIARAAREIGKMEAKFAASPPQKSQTKAPPASQPVGSKAAPYKKPEDMTTEEYIVWKNKQDRGG